MARWDSASDLAKGGVAFLLHGLLDYVLDGHFDVVQSLDDEIEALEDSVFAEQADYKEVQLRSLVYSLMRGKHLVSDELVPYYQYVYDHVLRASEWTDSLRDLVITIRETQLNLQSNRLNTIMKKLTGWAAIIAVPTAITGFYGQNVPYPGNGTPAGFWVSTAVIILIGGGLFFLFRRRNWL